MSEHRGIGRLTRYAPVLLACLLFQATGAQAAPANAAPVIAGTPPATAPVFRTYDFRPVAYDPNRDPLVFTAFGVPNWAKFDRATGRLTGTPRHVDLGRQYSVFISVSDGRLTAALPRFTITVTAGGLQTVTRPPSIGGTPPASVVEGQLYGFLPTASDPDGDPLVFGITGKPGWATFTSSSGLLSGIPPAGSAGTYSNIRISVSDGRNHVSLPAFSIQVTPKPNSPPAIWGIPETAVVAGESYAFQPSASDPEGQPLSFSVQGLPAWAGFDTATGRLSGTPAPSHAGTHPNIVISVSDGKASSSLAPFSITVTAPNLPPTIGGSPAESVNAGSAYSFTPTASDPEGQALGFSIANQPEWASFDPATGRLSGTPDSGDAGTYAGIVISASDGQYTAALGPFSITVIAVADRSATVSWVPPTTYVDGSPMTDLAGFKVTYGQSPTALTQVVTIASPEITSATIEDLDPGTWYFAVKAYTASNVESDLSVVRQKTVN